MLKSFTGKKGFTLPELMTTVAIIGAVASISIPSYLAMRVTANMEKVRQSVRVIGEKMSELYNRTGSYPAESDWPLTSSTDTDEVEIALNLDAIDKSCYTTNGYATNSNRTTYEFCVQPKSDACKKTGGTKQFCVHTDPQFSAKFPPGVAAEVSFSYSADLDSDGDVDLTDFDRFDGCFGGPDRPFGGENCGATDFDKDGDADLNDFAYFQNCFNGPNQMPAHPQDCRNWSV